MIRNKILPIILFVLFIFGVLFSQQPLNQRYTPESSFKEILHLPDGKILKITSLGFSSLVADFLWLKSVLYFGKYMFDDDNPYVEVLEKSIKNNKGENILLENKNVNRKDSLNFSKDENLASLHDFECKGLAPYIYPLLERIVELNPYFIASYRFGGLIVLHETGEIDQAYELLKYGWEHNPQNWEIVYYLGFIDLLYKGNVQKALEWLSHALMIPGHPPFIQDVYNSLLQKGNYKNVVIDYLKGIYESSEDVKLREQILEMFNKIAEASNSTN